MSLRDRFSWFFTRQPQDQRDPSKNPPRRPAPRDLTGGFAANEDALWGLYRGTWPGLQFASPLARVPVDVPTQMMGLPTPRSADKRTQEALDEITAWMAERIPKLHKAAFVTGTAWRWPRWDAAALALVWEEIRDSAVSDILLGVDSGKARAILTDEEFVLSVDENRTVTVRRKRRFDLQRVSVTWAGQVPADARDVTARNVIGILPIAFAHDAMEGEFRGCSEYSPYLRDLKDYHDIDYMRSTILTKFRPKQKQSVEDVKEWCKNNLGTDDVSQLAEYDVAESDLVINRFGKEETDYEFMPADATAPHEKALQNKFWKIFEGSRVPEMFWGGLAQGNHASADVQMQQLVTYVDDLRRGWNRPYADLYGASLRLLSLVRMETYQPFTMGWNRLEAISAEAKSQIFARFCQATASAIASGAMTKPMLYELWKQNYPELDPGTQDEFEAGITSMAKHAAFARAPYEMVFDKPEEPEGDDSEGESGEVTA